MFVVVIKPLMVTAYKEWLGYADDSAGYLLAIEFSGEVLMIFAMSMRIHRWDRRTLAFAGLSIVIAGNLLSMVAGDFASLASARLVAGIGTGVAEAAMCAALAGSDKPTRNFAIYNLALLSVGAVGYMTLPALLDRSGLDGIFQVLIVVAIPAMASLRWLPRFAPAEHDRKFDEPARQSVFDKTAFMALAATGLYFLGAGIFWPFVGEIGRSTGLDTATVAYMLAAAQVAGCVGALLAAILDTRWGRSIPIAVAIVGNLACFAALLLWPGDSAAVLVAIPVFHLFWLVVFPYFNGVAASLDRSGRLSVVSMTILSIGLAFGPAFGGWLNVATGGYRALVILAFMLVAVAGAIILRVASTMSRRRLDADPPRVRLLDIEEVLPGSVDTAVCAQESAGEPAAGTGSAQRPMGSGLAMQQERQ